MARAIGSILDFVHDRTFQVDKVLFERERGVISIPLTVIADEKIKERKILFVKTWRCAIVKAVLRIKQVLAMEMIDDAKIGEVGINTISMGNDGVLIKCSVPVEVRAKVSSFDVELELSDTVVGEVKRFALL